MYSVSDLNKEETKKIGKRLLAIRKKLEIMQRDMAKEIGISSGSLSSIESGIYMPRFEQLYHLIGKYNVSISYIIFGQGPMFMAADPDTAIQNRKYGEESQDWLKRLYYYFNESELFRYSLMSYVSKYMMENKKIIDAEIKARQKDKDDES